MVVTARVLPSSGSGPAGSAGISCSLQHAAGLSCPSPAPDRLRMCLHTDTLPNYWQPWRPGLCMAWTVQFVLWASFISESCSVAENQPKQDAVWWQSDAKRQNSKLDSNTFFMAHLCFSWVLVAFLSHPSKQKYKNLQQIFGRNFCQKCHFMDEWSTVKPN